MTKQGVSLWNIFTVFAKIGAFTIGGGYAMIPLIEAEMLKRGWISQDDMPDIIVLAASLVAVVLLKVSPIYIILVTIIIAVAISMAKEARTGR